MPFRNFIAALVAVAGLAACTTQPVPQSAPAQSGAPAPAESLAVQPPVASKRVHTTELHGEKLTDDYYWFREKTNPEVIRHLEAENAYTASVMQGTESLQKKLYDEMLSRIKQTDVNVPHRYKNHFYYSRTEEGKQYPIYCRKKGSLEAPEQVLLDANQLAKGHKYFAIGAYQISPDENLLAYTTDVTGFRQYTLQIKDLRTGVNLPDRIEKTTSVTWANNARTLFYVVEDHAKRPYRFYRHPLGSTNDDLLYEEKDELFRIGGGKSRSERYIFLSSSSSNTSEVRYLEADTPSGPLRVVEPRRGDHRYDVDHHSDRFYILTNDAGKNSRLVYAPVASPGKGNWVEVIPHRADVKLDYTELFAGHLVVAEKQAGVPHMRVIDLKTSTQHRIDFPEPSYSVFSDANREFNTRVFRLSYQSFVTPSSVYDYDLDARTRVLLKRQEVLGGYNPDEYVSERIQATASDGTKVPVSLVYKKGINPRANNPTLLYSYGSYGSTLPIAFSSMRLSLLNRGVIYAAAHIRGGGDLGKEWHDQGKMLQKKNTFTDFIAAAEQLIGQGYTSRDKLVISGGSAGGLLMGAVTNMRPDLFKAVVANVPFVDVVNTMLDETLPLTVGEFLEWGNPKKKEEYDYIRSYDPYTNIEQKAYPAMLVTTSLNDSQVMYWEATKYVAKLRAHKSDHNPLLLKVNMGAGHGGASGRYDRLKEIAFEYAFMLQQWGLAGHTL